MALSVVSLRKLYLGGVITTQEFWMAKKRRKIRSRKVTYSRFPFAISRYSNDECMILFRFNQSEIIRLLRCLKLRNWYRLGNGTKFTGINCVEGLCIVLSRLSYPNRLSELVKTFHRDPSAISRIFNFMINHIYHNHSTRITHLSQHWLRNADLEQFTEATSLAGSLLPKIVGFIDGTARPICRPKYNQRSQYSGYKKQHVIKYQSVVYPNGLIGRLDGPFNGRRHDAAILHLSGILTEMQARFTNADGSWYSVYGDPGYSNQKFIKVGYKNMARLNERQLKFNSEMSAIRVSVEYGFGKILQQFAFLDLKKIKSYIFSL